MRTLARVVFTLLATTLLFSCAQQKHNPPAGLLRDTCVMSKEPLEAGCPTVDYNGGKLGFCCDKCMGNWNKLDEAGKKAKFDAAAAKK